MSLLLCIVGVFLISLNDNILIDDVFAQSPQLATFQEIARIIVDRLNSNVTTSSISLQTTSNLEIKVGSEIEEKILNLDRITSIVFTNKDQCVLGIQDSTCLLINIKRVESEAGINAMHESARNISESIIQDLNRVLLADMKFHSIFINQNTLSQKNIELTQSFISVVYTEPYASTDYIFEGLSALLLAKEITKSQGFYLTAKSLSLLNNSIVTFSILKQNLDLLYQIQVSATHQNHKNDKIDPLDYFNIESLQRSEYFSQGFYPFNSILHVIIIPKENITFVSTDSKLEYAKKNNVSVPLDLTKSGWLFKSDSGSIIDARYLFGNTNQIEKKDSMLVLDTKQDITSKIEPSYSIVIIILVIVVIMVIFYLRGYNSKEVVQQQQKQ